MNTKSDNPETSTTTPSQAETSKSQEKYYYDAMGVLRISGQAECRSASLSFSVTHANSSPSSAITYSIIDRKDQDKANVSPVSNSFSADYSTFSSFNSKAVEIPDNNLFFSSSTDTKDENISTPDVKEPESAQAETEVSEEKESSEQQPKQDPVENRTENTNKEAPSETESSNLPKPSKNKSRSEGNLKTAGRGRRKIKQKRKTDSDSDASASESKSKMDDLTGGPPKGRKTSSRYVAPRQAYCQISQYLL